MHPALDASGTCPVTGQTYEWAPPKKGEVRSPCPALNTLANHGYLPRNGKNISVWVLMDALQRAYGIGLPLALFLGLAGYAMLHGWIGVFTLRSWCAVDLDEVARHGRVEHDASLVHPDTPEDDIYAPIHVDPDMLEDFLDYSKTTGQPLPNGGFQKLMDAEGVGRCRAARQKVSRALNPIYAEIARGEMAIALGIFNIQVGSADGIPVEWLREWLVYERIPTGWKPTHVHGFMTTVKKSKEIRATFDKVNAKDAAAPSISAEEPGYQDEYSLPLGVSGHSIASSDTSDVSILFDQQSRETTPMTEDEGSHSGLKQRGKFSPQLADY